MRTKRKTKGELEQKRRKEVKCEALKGKSENKGEQRTNESFLRAP